MGWALLTQIQGAFTPSHFIGSLLGLAVAVVIMVVASVVIGMTPNPLDVGLIFWLLFTPALMVGDIVGTTMATGL